MISTPAAASERTCARASSSVLKLAGSARPDVMTRGPLSSPESMRRLSSMMPGIGPPPDINVVKPASRNSCIRCTDLLAEPLLRVAVDDVAVRVDVTGQDSTAAGVERRLARGGGGSRGTGGNRDDAAVVDDDRAARDVRADVENARVGDDEILRRRQ